MSAWCAQETPSTKNAPCFLPVWRRRSRQTGRKQGGTDLQDHLPRPYLGVCICAKFRRARSAAKLCAYTYTQIWPDKLPPEYKVRKSNFRALETNFNVRKSNFNVRKSNFNVRKSNFNVRKTNFRVRKSNFRVRKSNFRVRKSNFRVRKVISGCGKLISGCGKVISGCGK